MKFIIIGIFQIFLSISFAVGGADLKAKDPNGKQKMICKSQKEIRVLVLEPKGLGCEVLYTKQGSGKIIAQQKQGTLRCEDVFNTLKERLAKGGFSCEAE